MSSTRSFNLFPLIFLIGVGCSSESERIPAEDIDETGAEESIDGDGDGVVAAEDCDDSDRHSLGC